MIDFGCSAYACIGDTFAQAFYQEPFSRPRILKLYNGKIFTTTHPVKIRMNLANDTHQEDVPMFVTPGLHHDIILGMP